MSQETHDGSSPHAGELSAETYAAFVGQIELSDIWVRSLTVDNRHGPRTPERTTIQVDGNATWELSELGFRAFQHYVLRFQETDALLAEISVTFGLDFLSQESLTDTLFAVFCDVNLPVNAWPYLREIVATTMGRMGWVAVTLPTFKVGTDRRLQTDERRDQTGQKKTGPRRTKRPAQPDRGGPRNGATDAQP